MNKYAELYIPPDYTPSTKILLCTMNSQIKYIDKVPGNENLVSVVRKILDAFIGITNNFKTVILNPLKTVKRSELLVFIETHRLQVKKLHELPYTTYRHVELPIPKGMQTTYPIVADILKSSFTLLDIMNLSELATKFIKNIHDSVLSNVGQLSTTIQSAFSIFNATIKSSIEKDLNRAFNVNSKILDLPFVELYKSMTEFTNTIDTLLNLAKNYTEADQVYKNMEMVQTYLSKLVDILEDDPTRINKEDIKSLGDVTYLYADMFNLYGTILQQYHRVEHNAADCYKQLIHDIKL